MIRLTGNRLARVLITVFTSFAVTASFCPAAMEPLMGAGFSAERAGSADKRIDSVIPFPEEEPALLTKTEDLGFTSLRTGFQRILNPCGPGGTRSAVFSLYRSSLGMGSNADFINVKKTILLKLRI